MNSTRNYSIDFLKFICMYGIIILHLTGQGGLISFSNNLFSESIYRVINNVFLVSVNVFCIITGYLYVDKKTNNKNIVSYIIMTLFYSLLITSIFYSFNLYNVRSNGLLYFINSIFPSMIGRYWFITCYILLFFLIPYINKFIKVIKKNDYIKLLFVLFILFCIVSDFFAFDYFRLSWGYSPFWLIYLYLIGAFIKKYGFNISKKETLIWYFVSMILNVAIMLLIKNYKTSYSVFYDFANRYTSPLLVISSILLFNIFINIQMKNNIFCKLGKYSLAVIIIHGHRLIYDKVIFNSMIYIKPYNIILELLFLFGIAFLIYIFCSIIEIIRKQLFRIFKIDKLIEIIGSKLDNYLSIN